MRPRQEVGVEAHGAGMRSCEDMAAEHSSRRAERGQWKGAETGRSFNPVARRWTLTQPGLEVLEPEGVAVE
ncbi:MAG: hypothetical protein R2748_12990 [Bryobacterales bacterium]